VASSSRGLDRDVYFQIGLLAVLGPTTENAILIVQFARTYLEQGMGLFAATLTAAKVRLRPIVRTSLALVALAFALAFQGSRPLWDPDEGRYVDVALEMLRLGDFWTPHLHHEVPHYSKPPLTYWAIAGSFAVFGRNEWAARLPNALAFAATIVLVGRIARRLAPGAERTAALVYATSLLPFVAASVITTDTLLAAFVAAGALGLVELRWGDGDPRRSRLLLGGGFGLAFLVKGPPALLPLAGLLAAARLAAPPARPERRLASAPALLLFAALAFGWFAHEVERRPDLLAYLLGAEVFDRVASPAFDRHDGWVGLARAYGPPVVAGLLPWWPLALRRRTRASAEPAAAGGGAPARFLALWIALPLAVFCFSRSRLPLYLLPLAAPAAIAVARRLGRWPRGRGARAAALAWAALLLALRAGSAHWPSPRDGRAYAAEIRRAAGGSPREVVYVETRPRYSLAFYLDCEVEAVDLDRVDRGAQPPAYRPLAEPLADEIRDLGEERVFLVPPEHVDDFVAELAGLGFAAPALGRVRGHLLFGELFPLERRVSAGAVGGALFRSRPGRPAASSPPEAVLAAATTRRDLGRPRMIGRRSWRARRSSQVTPGRDPHELARLVEDDPVGEPARSRHGR